MLTSFRGRFAASLALAGATLAIPSAALAQEEDDGGLTISANAALTTDYRFRGVSLSGGDPAIQGGVDVGHESGFYVGTWASSIDGGPAYGEMEFDIYGGWSGDLAEGIALDVGLLYYAYPTEDLGGDVNYWEPYASVGFDLGGAEATVGAAYAWEQDSLGGEDNLYVYTDLGYSLPSTPISLSAHLGYTDGVLAPPLLAGTTDDSGFDWSIGASLSKGILEVGVAYIGVEGPSIDGFTDDAIVGTITASF
ncbi:TorF family putative porin [Qipengyuania sphaerica]|uniref:TorF family putative porin n=1 Tax=Qipengyuania sphaerica TaxID=2867243 RepID=UPI001C8755E7|nr:TorF family putative porin [Qipengyuania sphaerica]MBX7539914.1 TorF family putative porin [Qipengyuania sphaerica]